MSAGSRVVVVYRKAVHYWVPSQSSFNRKSQVPERSAVIAIRFRSENAIAIQCSIRRHRLQRGSIGVFPPPDQRGHSLKWRMGPFFPCTGSFRSEEMSFPSTDEKVACRCFGVTRETPSETSRFQFDFNSNFKSF